MRLIKIFSALFFIAFALKSNAQESINSTGSDISGSGGIMSYSLGQVFFSTNTGSSGSVAEGVQQPFEISVVTRLEEAKGINLMVSAYPNPVTDNLILTAVDNFEFLTLNFQLYDMNGNLLQSEKITGNQTSIVMSNLVPATYFVKVTESNKDVKTFKIIKK